LDSLHGSGDDADVFEAEGSNMLRELTSDEVSNILMSNPDRTMPAKGGKNVLSIKSRTKYFKHEPPAVQKWAEMKRKRTKREDNKRKTLKISAANTPTITSMLNLLLPGTETEDNVVLVSSVQHPRQKRKGREKYDCEREREKEENFQLSSVHL
jgi:hypothetical protein